MILKASIDSMSGKLCHCQKSPVLSGQGTPTIPFELEEDGLEYATPPSLSSPNPPAPVENTAPIPIPTPAADSLPRDSDAENIPPACCASATGPTFAPMLGRLVEVEETEDEANWVSTEQFRRGVENRELVVRQLCVRTKRRRVDQNPYRMALGDKSQQRGRDLLLARRGAKFHADYHVPSVRQLRKNGRALDGVVQRHRPTGYQSDSESGSSGLSCDTNYRGHHHSLS